MSVLSNVTAMLKRPAVFSRKLLNCVADFKILHFTYICFFSESCRYFAIVNKKT